MIFREAVLAFLGVKDQQEAPPAQRRDQAVGEHCRGADVEECRRYFGEEMLSRVCSTCPD